MADTVNSDISLIAAGGQIQLEWDLVETLELEMEEEEEQTPQVINCSSRFSN